MFAIALLVVVTILYAGYNLLIKVSGTHLPAMATTTILATISLQLATLVASGLFLGFLALRGGQVFALTPRAYLWAALAGLCAGSAEIGYFYLLGGVGVARPMAASVAIPTVVSGTVVIALILSVLVLGERIAWNQILGGCLIVLGIVALFVRSTGSP
jgi:drug/metabolite transporter (DMT)-like permease